MQQIRIKLKSFDMFYLTKSIKKICEISSYVGLKNLHFISLPTTKSKFTLLRSPHIDKKSREQFEIRRYKIQIVLSTQNLYKTSLFLYILKNSELPGIELYTTITYLTGLK